MTKEFLWDHVPTFSETNLVGNVYFAVYAAWQGSCREHFLLTHAPGTVAQLQSRELALVTLSMSMDYLAECFAGDHLTVGMSVAAIDAGRVTMTFRFRRDGQVVATGRQSVAAMKIHGGRLAPCPLPADFAAALERFR